MVLIETVHSPRWIRTLGLRVASSLRHPLEVTSLQGQRVTLSADIAAGIVHLSQADKDVDQLLHEVQAVAQAARAMRSRAALLDLQTRQAVPVDSAHLDGTWRDVKAGARKSRRPARSARPAGNPAAPCASPRVTRGCRCR